MYINEYNDSALLIKSLHAGHSCSGYCCYSRMYGANILDPDYTCDVVSRPSCNIPRQDWSYVFNKILKVE